MSGAVVAHGPGGEGPAVGTRVMGICHFGAHAEYAVVPARFALPMPDGMTFPEGASIPWNYLTAYQLVFRSGQVRAGERVLVHMAAGGVGTAILQLLRTIPDVTVFGTASANKHSALFEEGCAHAIDYRTRDYVREVMRMTDGEGVDVVLDPLGGDDWRKGYSLLRPAGRLVAYGLANVMAGGQRRELSRLLLNWLRTPSFTPVGLLNANRGVMGVSTGRLWETPDLLAENLSRIQELCHEDRIHPRVDSVHGFDAVRSAYERIASRKNIGKVVLVPREPARTGD